MQDEKTQRDLPQGLLAVIGSMVGLGPVRFPVRGFARAFSSLEHPVYRYLWPAALCSTLGTWMQNVAAAWLLYDMTKSEVLLGIDQAVTSLPIVLLLPLSGVLADKVSRKTLLVISNITMLCAATFLSVSTACHWLVWWHIIAVSFVQGLSMGLAIPSIQSLVPAIVGEKYLNNAIALNAIQFNLSRALGPAIGGIMYEKAGAQWSFGANALSFLPILGVLLWLRAPAVKKSDDSIIKSLAGGFAYVRSRRDLVTMLALIVLVGVCVSPVMTMLPAYVSDQAGGQVSDYSTLLSLFGAGALIGAAMLAARSDQRPTPWRALPIAMLMSLCLISLGYFHHEWVIRTMVFVTGVAFSGSMVRLFTAIISSTPDAVRGRVSSYQVLAFRSGMPIGALTAGFVAKAIGVNGAFILNGSVLLVLIVFVAQGVRRHEVEYQHRPISNDHEVADGS
ncbi:MAG: MFS transporter [Phycisphaera sp.]|nr:MFS transporter [Phycisphaera sp.]